MPVPAKLVGFELIVHEIDSALALFVDAMGLELVSRHTSTDPAGEIAIINAGDAAITLLKPATDGPGHMVPKREPRLSQIIFSTGVDDVTELASDVAEHGIAAQRVDDARFFVPPAVCEGLLGIHAAVVVIGIDDDAADDRSENG